MSSLLLNKRIIIVTGAAGGLGQAMVEGLLTEGATILAVDQNEANLKKSAELGKDLFHRDVKKKKIDKNFFPKD